MPCEIRTGLFLFVRDRKYFLVRLFTIVITGIICRLYTLGNAAETNGRFLSGGIILGSPLSCPNLFLYTITLPAVSREAPATLSYTTLEMASRVLLSSKKLASRQQPGLIDDKSTLDAISREGRRCVPG